MKNGIDEILGRFFLKWGNRFDYSKMNYIRCDKKIEIICKEHGSFWQLPIYHWRGQNGCKKCFYNERKDPTLSNSTVIKRFEDKHLNRYDYSKMNYLKYNKVVEIICKDHGSFFLSPKQHWDGLGCPECKKKEQFGNLIERFKNTHGDLYNYSKISNYSRFDENVEIICKDHGSFLQLPTNHINGSGCPKCGKTNLEEDIEKNFNCFELFNRDFIKPLEIDLLNHEYKFGIELNGVLWHSYGKNFPNNYNNLNKNKHLNKTNLMEEKGYQLFYITDLAWNNPIKKEIWKSVINNKIGNSYKFFARKLKIIDLSNHKEFVKSYLNENHLQGQCNYLYAYGLCNEKNEVYSIMTFGKSRFDKNIEYELLRFCNLKNTSVIGGANKLLKHFERTIKPRSLISYANRDWSQGNLYETLGFTFSHHSPPNSWWWEQNSKKFHHRINFQKHKLEKILENFNNNLTELENMFNHNYRLYYDTGNLVFLKQYKNSQWKG